MARRYVLRVGHPSYTGGPGANRPADHTYVVHEPCNSLTLTPGQWDGGGVFSGSTVALVDDMAMPTGKAIEFRWPYGSGEGATAGRNTVTPHPNGLSELYVRMLIRHNPGWQIHSSGNEKLVWWGIHNHPISNNQFIPMHFHKAGVSRIGFVDQSGASDGGSEFSVYADQNPIGTFTIGDVVEVECLMTAQSAPGVSDGTVRMWANGTEVTVWRQTGGGLRSLTNQNFVGSSGTEVKLGRFKWWPFPGGSGDTKLVSPYDWMRFGDLYISGKP